MRFKVTKTGIEVIPECEIDEAYIENTLLMKEDGDFIRLVRKNASGLGCLGYLTTTPFPLPATMRQAR